MIFPVNASHTDAKVLCVRLCSCGDGAPRGLLKGSERDAAGQDTVDRDVKSLIKLWQKR